MTTPTLREDKPKWRSDHMIGAGDLGAAILKLEAAGYTLYDIYPTGGWFAIVGYLIPPDSDQEDEQDLADLRAAVEVDATPARRGRKTGE